MAEKLILGITMGDPASIGPEITVKALAKKEIYDECRPLVIGDAAVMEEAAKIVGREDIDVYKRQIISWLISSSVRFRLKDCTGF